MNDCIRAPALTLAQLSALLDGDADPAVSMHVEQCPSCRQRAAQLAIAQDRLRALLWRTTCPDPEQLRDYAWNLLPEHEAAQLEHHLVYCPYCSRDVLYIYYAGDTSGDDLFTQAARRLGAMEYRSALGLNGSSVAHARFVGAEGETQIFDGGDGVLINLLVLRDEAQGDRWVMEGAVSGIDTNAMQVHLWLEEQLIAALVLDAAGDFRVAQLAAGDYQFIVHGTNVKWRVGPLQVGFA